MELLSNQNDKDITSEPPSKRVKYGNNDEFKPLTYEVEYLAKRLTATWDRQ